MEYVDPKAHAEVFRKYPTVREIIVDDMNGPITLDSVTVKFVGRSKAYKADEILFEALKTDLFDLVVFGVVRLDCWQVG